MDTTISKLSTAVRSQEWPASRKRDVVCDIAVASVVATENRNLLAMIPFHIRQINQRSSEVFDLSNDSKMDIKEEVILAVAQALAIHHVARKFGIDSKMAKSWFIHHRDLVCPNSCDSAGLKIENHDNFRVLINKIIDDNPGIDMGRIAELLCNEMLTPGPLKGKVVKEIPVQEEFVVKSETRNSANSGMKF